MTAQRWWVQVAARWLARIDGVSGQIRLAMLGLTGTSTALITLKQYGHGRYAWPLVAAIVLGSIAYTYLYTEGGVWNQVSRDRADLSGNYAPPTMYMDDVCTAIAVFTAVHKREPSADELQTIETGVRRQWVNYRDGIDVDDLAEPPEQPQPATGGDD